MSVSSSIQWTDATWNPTRGCSRVSEGCRNCYAERQAIRFSGPGKPYHGLVASSLSGPKWTGVVELDRETLGDPLRWKKPRRIFVDSMSDLFHEGLTFDEIDAVVAVMALSPWHVFQVLTKRPERMVEYFLRHGGAGRFLKTCYTLESQLIGSPPRALPPEGSRLERAIEAGWPPSNVWWGTSAESVETLERRLPWLLKVPSAQLFASIEPLLERVDVAPYLTRRFVGVVDGPPGLEWVIVGGESGPGSRPCDVRWIRDVAVRCLAAEVPVFVKQLGRRVVVPTARLDQFPREALTDPVHRALHEDAAALFATSDPLEREWTEVRLFDSAGGEPSEWPEDLRVRQLPAGMIGSP